MVSGPAGWAAVDPDDLDSRQPPLFLKTCLTAGSSWIPCQYRWWSPYISAPVGITLACLVFFGILEGTRCSAVLRSTLPQPCSSPPRYALLQPCSPSPRSALPPPFSTTRQPSVLVSFPQGGDTSKSIAANSGVSNSPLLLCILGY